MSNKSRIPTSPHAQSFIDLYDDDDYYSNNEDLSLAMAVQDPLNHSAYFQMDQQYTYHRPEYDQDHFIPNPNDKKSPNDSLSSYDEDAKNQIEPQLNQVTMNENKVNDYCSNMTVADTQDNATNTITSATSNTTAISTHNTTTDIHGTSIHTRDAAADVEHTTHIDQEVCDKNAPLVDNDEIKPNVANDINPVATELNSDDNVSTSGNTGAGAKKKAVLKANKKDPSSNVMKKSTGTKRKTSQAKLSNDDKEGEPNKIRRSSRGKVPVEKVDDDFMEEDLVSTEQVDITVPTKRKYAKAKGKAVKSSSTSSDDSSTINDLQNISYLLTNRNSFLTHESIKDQIQDWILHLSKEEKTELAKLLPKPDLDNGKWNEDLAFLDGPHFWEAFQQWQEILFLGGFEETFKTEIETSDDNTFKDENYEAFWGEKLK